MSTTLWTRPSDGRTFRAEHTARPFFVRHPNADRYFGTERAARAYLNELGSGQLFFDYAPGTGVLVDRL